MKNLQLLLTLQGMNWGPGTKDNLLATFACPIQSRDVAARANTVKKCFLHERIAGKHGSNIVGQLNTGTEYKCLLPTQ
jgi:hypothetical protein